MPPKKNPGARRRGTTLSLNEFLRDDDNSNPTDPTPDPNPPMATNGSSRSRNRQPPNRSRKNARQNGEMLSPSAVGSNPSNPVNPTDTKPPMATNGSNRSRNRQPPNRSRKNARQNGEMLSPSAVGSNRSDPVNPTDTKPPMATFGANRSRNSAHQYNDQTSKAAVGSNRSGNKSRRNGDRPFASNRSGNKSRRNGGRPSASAVGSNRSHRESNPPKPTNTNPQCHQFGGLAGSNCPDNGTLQNYENPYTADLGYNQTFRPGVKFHQLFGYKIATIPDQELYSPSLIGCIVLFLIMWYIITWLLRLVLSLFCAAAIVVLVVGIIRSEVASKDVVLMLYQVILVIAKMIGGILVYALRKCSN